MFILVIAAASLSAPVALADSTSSTNWAGYAVHGPGVSFRSVYASWIEPNAACSPGNPTWSAYWVGLGGYAPASSALEQVGTEVDCSLSGRVVSSAWFELVPAGSIRIALNVRPGDRMRARVTVTGRHVTIVLSDVTRHRRFEKTLRARSIDVSSADWIVEAPEGCPRNNSCRTLPLADFVSASFRSAGAVSTSGRRGPISDRHWQATSITLNPNGPGFVGFGPSAGAASPSALTARGTSFKVTYSRVMIPDNRRSSRASSALSAGRVTP